jgi:branched-chain amino acid transport system ATP-binding protein
MTPAIEIERVEGGYEPGLPILRGASVRVAPGEIVALLGPNGAGKSTLVKAAAGLVPVWSGHVRLGGRDITGLPAHRMVGEGLGFVPQTENVFANLSVTENLQLAAALVTRSRRRAIGEMFALFPDLDRQRGLPAGRLSGGQRQMLAVARALVASPSVLMLDEPSAGLSPKLVGVVFERLKAVRDTGVTILLVEQNVKAALGIADRAVVLVEGRGRLEGPASELADDRRLAALYLGAAAEAG